MLDQSMSTKRIALTLNLSLNTVKWNVKNIFGKLGVIAATPRWPRRDSANS